MNPHTDHHLPFVIRILNTEGYRLAPPVPCAVRWTYSFVWLHSGEMLVVADELPMLVRAHDFLLLPPSVPFSISWYNCSRGCMGGFAETFLKDSGHRVLSLGGPTLFSVPDEDWTLCEEIFGKMTRCQDDMAVVKSSIDLMLSQMDGPIANRVIPREGPAQHFMESVFNVFPLKSGVSEYAMEIGISANYLNRVVKKATGKSAGEWLDIARMSRAKTLLRDGSMSIADIAFDSGLSDQAYFSRFFKKYEGMTPSEYRAVLKSPNPSM